MTKPATADYVIGDDVEVSDVDLKQRRSMSMASG